MAYDETLAARIRSVLAQREDVTERKMFGGVAFMVGDRMAVGVIRDNLMVRVGPEAHDEALARPRTRPMGFSGRLMRAQRVPRSPAAWTGSASSRNTTVARAPGSTSC